MGFSFFEFGLVIGLKSPTYSYWNSLIIMSIYICKLKTLRVLLLYVCCTLFAVFVHCLL